MSKHGWTYKKLGEVCEFYRGLTYKGTDEVDFSSNVVLRSNNIDLATFTLNFDDLKHITEDILIPEDKLIKKNSLLICMSNGSKQHLGKVAFIDRDYPYAFGGFMGLIKPNGNDIYPKFVYYYCCSPKYKNFLFTIGNGANINNLRFTDIAKNQIPVPGMAEQEAIVAELDEINEAIAALQQQVADLDTLAQSTFYDMFGDPVTNPKAWPVKKLNESVQEMFLGPFGSALKVSSYVSESESFAMVYEQKHAIQGTINLDNHYINKEKFDSLARFEVKPKDFIMSCRGTIGRIFQLPDNAPKGIIHPSLMKIRIKNEVYDYSFFVVLLQKIIAEQTTKGNCVQMAITAKELGNMYFILPPLALQQEFAAKVEAIESAKAELNALIAEMQTLLASRMDYYFE